MTKQLITASIIAKNEEEMIGDMLDSIKGVKDMVIADTGSTDQTVKIARSKGAKVYTQYEWKDDFSEARNYSKSKCKGEWLLIIDCDETLIGSVEVMYEMLQSDRMKDYDAVYFSVDTGAEVNDQMRLVRNLDSVQWVGAAHNILYMKTDKGFQRIPDNRIFKSSFKIKAGFSPNHERDPDRTLRILKKGLQKNPNNTRYMYYIAREFLNRKDVFAGIFWMERYAKVAPPTNELADTYYIMATCYLDTGDMGRALDCCMQSLKLLPSNKAPWALLHNLAPEQYKKYWKAGLDTADNKGTLFVREKTEKIIDIMKK
jgi:glycosyltransferase involved in cell wall biosynthesis